MASLELSPDDLKRILGKLDRVGKSVDDRLIRQELTRTGRQLRTEGARRVKRDLPKLPYGTILRRFEAVGVYSGEGGNMTLEVKVRKRPINLARFGARQTKQGIRAVQTIAGESKGPFRHAFIITARFGSGDGEKQTQIVVQRLGKGGARKPVKALFGPTIMGVAAPVAGEIVQTAGERLLANIQRRIASEMKG